MWPTATSATAPASPKGTYFWCSTSGTPDRCIHAVVEMNRFRRARSHSLLVTQSLLHKKPGQYIRVLAFATPIPSLTLLRAALRTLSLRNPCSAIKPSLYIPVQAFVAPIPPVTPVRRPTEIGSFPAHKEGDLKPQSTRYGVFPPPPFKPSAKWCSDQGEMAGMPFQAHPRLERVWVDPDMGAILPIKRLVRGGISWLLLVAVDKK